MKARRLDLRWGLVLVALLALAGEGVAVAVLHLLLDVAPALVLAYVLTGLAAEFVPPSSLGWLRRGSRLAQAAKGTVIGLPLPLCSCSVIPVYHRLATRGPSPTAALAFLVAGPELGLDAFLVSLPLLGLHTTVLRAGVAVAVALVVALLVGSLLEAPVPATAELHDARVSPRGAGRVLRALEVGFGETMSHTLPWVLLGLVVAAVVGPTPAGTWLAGLSPSVQVVVLAAVGVPAYVCASAATPMVAALLAVGVSPGAAIAFLVTGPSTNVTTFGALARLHGRGVALAFVGGVAGCAVLAGLLLNLLPRPAIPNSGLAATVDAGAVEWAALLLLLAGAARLVVTRGVRWLVPAAVAAHTHHHHP